MCIEEMPEDTFLERKALEYQNLSDRFRIHGKDFTKQYCNIYNARLEQMKTLIQQRILKKWSNEYPICELHKLSETDYPKCIVFGTIFKDQKLKPSVLKQLAENNSLLPQPVHIHFTDDSDTLYIEDKLQRYQIVGNLNKDEIVTGVTCALLGSDLGKGKFNAEDYCFAGFQTQIERPLMGEDKYVAFISGLDLVNIEKSLLSLRFFVNWLSGVITDESDINIKVVRLIIAGNSTRIEHEKIRTTISLISRKTEMPEVVESVKVMDRLLEELAQVLEVDVMPGEHDPSNHILPQQPMHHCMYPKAMAYKSLNQVSNPYECQIGGLRFLGNSGQPISNILGFCEIPSAINTLEHCLRWSHMAPTAPDTLGCFPHYEKDPFIIECCPHIMFAGNQNSFDTGLVTGEDGQQVRLISIPEFARSKTVAILNLKNLECFPLTFNV